MTVICVMAVVLLEFFDDRLVDVLEDREVVIFAAFLLRPTASGECPDYTCNPSAFQHWSMVYIGSVIELVKVLDVGLLPA